jgi:hypothetical protein
MVPLANGIPQPGNEDQQWAQKASGNRKTGGRENQFNFKRRCGTVVNPDMVLPKRDNLRALSRSINAFSASRIKTRSVLFQ